MKNTYLRFSLGLIAGAGVIIACLYLNQLRKRMILLPPAENFAHTVDGKETGLYILKKGNMTAAITNYGARLVSLLVPDQNGRLTSVVAGFDGLDGYINSTEPYFGATIGRYGNRIAKGRFSLNGKSYQLSINNGPNTLHGGKAGFQYKVWTVMEHNDSTIMLSYSAKDKEEGFPGNLKVVVTYTLTEKNELRIAYEAESDRPTVINLTNHAFFNLNGEGSGTINNHRLQILAEHYTPVDSTLIPTGEIAQVAGTPFDFTRPKTIHQGLEYMSGNKQLQYGKGFDHNFVLSDQAALKHAASVTGDRSGIRMEVYTDQPGLQFYGGNFMQSRNLMREATDDFRTAFCLETQHFPDSPNQPAFPSTVLPAGQVYQTRSVYQFKTEPK